MDVEFTVDLIPGKRVLDDAFRDATSNMAQWLADQYKLDPSRGSRRCWARRRNTR
jgi:hypothetical protein